MKYSLCTIFFDKNTVLLQTQLSFYMKIKHLFISAIFLFGTVAIFAQQKKYSVYAVGFYNQENLFDTCHDAGKNDYEFLPNGSYKWTSLKYKHKIHNMAQALSDIGTDVLPQSIGCTMIGMAEVENDNVMNDLIAQEPLKARGYKYIHIEGPDARGIDCALLYNPRLFNVRNSKLVPYVPDAKDSAYKTRGFLVVSGTLAGEHVTVIVNHWPSRFAGSIVRERVAAQCRMTKDSVMRDDPNVKVIVMGDMNDDPFNKSMSESLRAKREISEVTDSDMYNPWWNVLVKEGKGTLAYNGSWNLFDQIVVSPNLINRDGSNDYKTLKFFKNQIFRRDYLIQQDGKYKGTPKRTTAGGVWLDGYSDHLPTVIYLIKQQ